MRRVFAFVLGLVMASPVIAAYVVDEVLTYGQPENKIEDTLDCGAIQGELGIITEWSRKAGTGNKKIVTQNGEVGAKWWEEQYDKCPALSENVAHSTLHYHIYKRKSGGARVSCKLTTDKVHSGTARRMNAADPSWWWFPTVEISDNQPAVQLWDKDYDKIGGAGWKTIDDGYEKTRIKNTGGKDEAHPPNPDEHLQSGYDLLPGDAEYGEPVLEQTWPRTFDAETANNVGNEANVRYIAILYQIDSSANRTADNAHVDDWKFYLKSTMETSVN